MSQDGALFPQLAHAPAHSGENASFTAPLAAPGQGCFHVVGFDSCVDGTCVPSGHICLRSGSVAVWSPVIFLSATPRPAGSHALYARSRGAQPSVVRNISIVPAPPVQIQEALLSMGPAGTKIGVVFDQSTNRARMATVTDCGAVAITARKRVAHAASRNFGKATASLAPCAAKPSGIRRKRLHMSKLSTGRRF